jgi:hypothetical protein
MNPVKTYFQDLALFSRVMCTDRLLGQNLEISFFRFISFLKKGQNMKKNRHLVSDSCPRVSPASSSSQRLRYSSPEPWPSNLLTLARSPWQTGRRRPVLPGAVLPPGPGLQRRRGHVLAQPLLLTRPARCGQSRGP